MGRWLAAGLALSLGLVPVGGLVLQAAMAEEAVDEQLLKLLDLANRQKGQGQLEAALDTYAKALAMARKLNDRSEEGTTLHNIGGLYRDLGKPAEALKSYQQALAIAQELKDRSVEGLTLNYLGFVYSSLGKPEEALKSYQLALDILREVKERLGEGLTLHNIGGVYRDLDKPAEALKNYQQALTIARDLKDRSLEVSTLNKIGYVYRDLGKPEEALKSYQQALEIRREVKDRNGEGATLNDVGGVIRQLGKPEEALRIYQQALEIQREVKDRRGEGTTLSNIGHVYMDLGKSEEALKSYQQALEIRREVKDRREEGTTLGSIGQLYATVGNSEEALNRLREALAIAQELNDPGGESNALNTIATINFFIGKAEEAQQDLNRSLAIVREFHDRHAEGSVLSNLGLVISSLGRPLEALSIYQQALQISREFKDRRREGITLNNIALAHKELGEVEEALKTFMLAAGIAQEVKNRNAEGIILSNIGTIYSDQGKFDEALKIFRFALEIKREVKDLRGEGNDLNHIAIVHQALGHHEEALRAFQQALVIARKTKHRMSESITLSSLAITLRDLQQPKPAIEHLENGLAIQIELRRGLQRSDRQHFLSQNQWAASALVELLIEQKMAAKAYTWVNLFATTELADYTRLIDAQVSDPGAQRALDQWRRRQVLVQRQRQQLEREANKRNVPLLVEQEAAQFRAAEELIGRYPEIAELLETRPADLQRLQAGIPAGTVVIQPAPLTGVPKLDGTMALFALTRSDLQVVTVPLPQDFPSLVETYRRQLENAESYLERSQQLYDLLIRPLEDRGLLPAGGRLAVIATGKLRDIPLETLYDGRTKQYLLEKYPIHYLTRLSRNGAPAAQPAGGGRAQRAMVLANPTPTARELPGTEAEANYLMGAFAGSRDLRRGQATLEQFQQQANRYPILHLGTHGCFVATGCPDLGMKANTLLFANRQQYPIAQAAQLGLSNTELLVLGACQTAQVTSDTDVGVSGLAYVWERAGARAVVASLWSAADAESAQITKAFYGNLKAGMDKAEAMRQAKLALLRRDPDGLHPYLWAPFILIGDAAPLAR